MCTHSKNIYVFSDKTRSLHEITKKKYNKSLTEKITRMYKKQKYKTKSIEKQKHFFIYLCIYLFIYLSIYLFIYLIIYLLKPVFATWICHRIITVMKLVLSTCIFQLGFVLEAKVYCMICKSIMGVMN